MKSSEYQRLKEESKDPVPPWRKWGPYVAERSWGTVREDYSSDGDAWHYFTHDMARSKVYRWGEDGLAGFSDRYQILVLSWAFWNEKDPILKERAFGLDHFEGNHGEDVKECYFYLDALPSHAYMKYLYKYPQSAFPYQQLLDKNKERSSLDPEFELVDTGIFSENHYFDIVIEYAKASPEDLCIKVEAFNRGDKDAPLHLMPQLCFRNTWSWKDERQQEPVIDQKEQKEDFICIVADDSLTKPLPNLLFEYRLGKRYFYGSATGDALFTNNEDRTTGKKPYKDAFHQAIVEGKPTNAHQGTKACLHYVHNVPAKSSIVLYFRLTPHLTKDPLRDVETIIKKKQKEADDFYETVHPPKATKEEKLIQRQAFAGMLWNKQIYLFDINLWLSGDKQSFPPPQERLKNRNSKWRHLNSMRILSMPDKWEYPWFAAWDLAFHSLTLGLIDIEFAKEQLWLLLFDQFQHPNGQIPAYEWEFSDLNPPIQAWAAWQLFNLENEKFGRKDVHFLKKCFDKLLINFAWWVNRVDRSGYNVFEGGFLGLDNISLFDRSLKSKDGSRLEQSDGTGWMALFCLNLMRIALELTQQDSSYESLATKFFQHFVYIAHSMKKRDEVDYELWNEEDGFFYDILVNPDGKFTQFRTRSLVGLIPLNAVELLTEKELQNYPEFRSNFLWFLKNRESLVKSCVTPLQSGSYLLSIVSETQLKRILTYVWNPDEFLAPFGLRSLSKYHEKHPVLFQDSKISYEPGEAISCIKGGNSNWRGPVWFPTTYFLISSLLKFSLALGKSWTLENSISLEFMAKSFANRLISLYQENKQGIRPFEQDFPFANDPLWKDLLTFYEYFHPETGKGLGASHQTGWTGLIANLIDQFRR